LESGVTCPSVPPGCRLHPGIRQPAQAPSASRDMVIRVTASLVLLIRHASPLPPTAGTSGTRDDERSLTCEGLLAADLLAGRMRARPITAVFSSPYRRALETVQPIASTHTLPVETMDDLRERRLSPSTLAEAAFLEALHRSRVTQRLRHPEASPRTTFDSEGCARPGEDPPRHTVGDCRRRNARGLISILRWHLGEEFTIQDALADPMPRSTASDGTATVGRSIRDRGRSPPSQRRSPPSSSSEWTGGRR
jgi:hypothetical protein